VDAEPVGQRRVDLERLAGFLHLLLLPEVLDRPQVVQAVGELDQDDAGVPRHREDHLPVVLRLRLLAALEVDAGQLRDAVDELADLLAELRSDLVEADVSVLDDVVQERSCDRLVVELKLGTDACDRVRMVDELLAGAALLALVSLGCEAESAREQLSIDMRVVLGNLGDQLADQVLMSLRSLENCHGFSVLRRQEVTSSARKRAVRAFPPPTSSQDARRRSPTGRAGFPRPPPPAVRLRVAP
jgi:hypothetical protein